MQTMGTILGKVFVQGGCFVFAMQDNESRIRGGHNFFQLRVGERPVRAASKPIHLLIALNAESVQVHKGEVAPEGIILFASEKDDPPEGDGRFLGLPMERLALEEAGNKIYSSSVAIGATMAVLGWDVKILEAFLRDYFSAKAAMVEGNVKAALAGFENAMARGKKYQGPKIPPGKSASRMFISGHEAVALGALTAGCQFMAAYPMSPSTSIMTYLAAKADDFDLVVEQAEDEIAAVNMAIGASYAGLRSMTATSGGGFSLMVEAFGLSGISETPLVIVNAQRPGPATGLPTRTEQADLLFVLHASQDEFPRVLLAPGNPREAFYQTIKAFNLADKYQVPVVIMTDQYLADSYFTEERFKLSGIETDRHLLSEKEAAALEHYKRYRVTESGISPRTIPGLYNFVVVADSHEHDEDGHITEDAGIRKKMMEKRFRKASGLSKEVNPLQEMGDQKADLLLAGWGSTLGPMSEAVECLNEEGIPVRGVHFNELWPFPKDDLSRIFQGIRKWAVVENNYTGQLARLIRMELQKRPDALILKYTGRPFLPEEIVASFKKEDLVQ
jgi:2-oxoglutarate ferredoxin oxidoreductase subunit alpha